MIEEILLFVQQQRIELKMTKKIETKKRSRSPSPPPLPVVVVPDPLNKKYGIHIRKPAKCNFNFTNNHVREVFSRYGKIVEVFFPPRQSSENYSWCILKFSTEQERINAINDGDNVFDEYGLDISFEKERR